MFPSLTRAASPLLGRSRFISRYVENSNMQTQTCASGSWHLRRIIGDVVGIMATDSSIVAELPQGKNGDGARIKEAYLIAAAPQLFDVCCKLNSILENSHIVTP